VVVARDIADLGAPDFTIDDLRDEWGARDFDLERDAALVQVGSEVVGYATVRRPGSLVVVSPAYERRGIGALLLEWTERREREWGRDRHRQWIASTNLCGREFLLAAGYSHIRSYSRMMIELTAAMQAAPPPAGHRFRPVDPDRDHEQLHALDAASFVVNPDYRPESLDAFREEHLEAHDFVAALSIVASAGDRITGFLLSRNFTVENAGFIDLLAVAPEHQRRGLATSMLLTAFAQYAAAGLSSAQLGVASDNPRALSLYTRVGMREQFRYDTYERAYD
jgi:mycothiol synthase